MLHLPATLGKVPWSWDKAEKPSRGARAPWAEAFGTLDFHFTLSLRFFWVLCKEPWDGNCWGWERSTNAMLLNLLPSGNAVLLENLRISAVSFYFLRAWERGLLLICTLLLHSTTPSLHLPLSLWVIHLQSRDKTPFGAWKACSQCCHHWWGAVTGLMTCDLLSAGHDITQNPPLPAFRFIFFNLRW